MQALRARLERASAAASGREPDDAALARALGASGSRFDAEAMLHTFRARASQSPFGGLVDPRTTADAVRARWSSTAEELVAEADRIANGQLALCGQLLCFGSAPDWTLESRSGRRGPRAHWSRIDYLDPTVAGDCKLTWELNRHHHLVTLGRAYALTGNETYAALCTRHLCSWMDANPPKVGINWTSSLELAFRAISWVWTLALLRSSPHLDARTFGRAVKYLHIHGRHLERYLSTYFSPNTHLTGEALGLLYLGSIFPEVRDATRWRAIGARILGDELGRQVLDDGVYFEQATSYHRYTTDFYVHALILARDEHPWLAQAILPKLEQLLDHLTHITRPDGTSPLIGDDDGGRLAQLGTRAPNDFRDTLAAGALLLGRSDYAFVATGPAEEACWLFGPSAIDKLASLTTAPPPETSRAFARSGYFIMRDGWSRDANYALVRCGLHGALSGGHAHADALSLELAVAGRPILVDAGTYTYTGSIEERNAFRSSAAHNTLTIDGMSSSEPGDSAFTWRTAARSTTLSWITHSAFDFFEGEHDGYHRLPAPALHRRAVLFLKNATYWVIRDRVLTNGPHRFDVHFHWAPGITLEQIDDRGLVARTLVEGDERPLVDLRILGDTGSVVCSHGWTSPSYGSRIRAATCALRLDASGTRDIITVIAPAGVLDWAGASTASVSESATVLTLPTPDGRDTLLVGADGKYENDGVRTDAQWLWLRRAPDGDVAQFVVIGARTLDVDGATLLRAEVQVEYAVGTRRGGRLSLDVHSSGPGSGVSRSCDGSRVKRVCAGSVE